MIKLITRTYVIEKEQDDHLQQEADKRKMSKSMYLRLLIDDYMIGVEQKETK